MKVAPAIPDGAGEAAPRPAPDARGATGRRLRPRLEGLFFVLLVATACQILYTPLGFNPTDEGYMLSGSRRILDGQVPHRDYISLRPVGTHLLHAHLLLWAGDRLIWWSRYVAWLQLAVTAWLWVRIVDRVFGAFPSVPIRFAMGIVAFTASAHTFPIMPWNSIDGVFFLTLGIALRLLAPARWWWAGTLLIGTTPLFRQNFVFPIPFLLLVLGDLRRWKSWIVAGLPCLLYGLFLVLAGGWNDAIVQNRSHGGFLGGVLLEFVYDRVHVLCGFAFGVPAMVLSLVAEGPALRRLALSIWLGAVAYAVVTTPMSYAGAQHGWFSLAAALPAVLVLLPKDAAKGRVALLALFLAWGLSISVGWATPALGAGPLLVVIAATAFGLDPCAREKTRIVFSTAVSLALAVIAVQRFNYGRTEKPYYDKPAPCLRYDLGGVLAGAKGIRTNRLTYGYLKDLDEAVQWSRANGKPDRKIAIVPEAAQYWATSPQPNPLSSDWPVDEELIAPGNRRRVLAEIDALEGKAIFIVGKYWAWSLWEDVLPLQPRHCAVCQEVRAHYQLVHETPNFEVYE